MQREAEVRHGMGGTPSAWPSGWPGHDLDRLLVAALAEDVGWADVTTQALVEPQQVVCATMVAKAEGVVAGLPVAARAFGLVAPGVRWRPLVSDGDRVRPLQPLAELEGPAAALLMAERVALNFLQHLCGIATLTASFVAAVGGRAQLLDTRKTTPGLRWLERYAVRTGGGSNHRFCLADGILIKDNHIRAVGSVREAVARARRRAPQGLRIEVECSTLAEVQEALDAGAEIILLDNMPLADIRAAVQRIAGRARAEASGGVTLANVAEVAACGVDAISVGALTHSAPALDISLEFSWGA